NGTPSKSVDHAMRVPVKSRWRFADAVTPSAASPAKARSISATSSALLAIGPSTLSTPQVGAAASDRHAADGRMPTTPQNAAGLRSDPPMSVPSAIGSIRHASATAAPPLLPPQVFVRSYGFSVGPNTGLNVCEPAPNSVVFVLPTTIAPAARSFATIAASASGTWSRKIGDP